MMNNYPDPRLHRQAYEQRETDTLDQTYENDPGLGSQLGGQAGAINMMRLRHGNERGQAAYAPQWDRWLDSVSNVTGDKTMLGGSIGGRESTFNGRAETPYGEVSQYGTGSELHNRVAKVMDPRTRQAALRGLSTR